MTIKALYRLGWGDKSRDLTDDDILALARGVLVQSDSEDADETMADAMWQLLRAYAAPNRYAGLPVSAFLREHLDDLNPKWFLDGLEHKKHLARMNDEMRGDRKLVKATAQAIKEAEMREKLASAGLDDIPPGVVEVVASVLAGEYDDPEEYAVIEAYEKEVVDIPPPTPPPQWRRRPPAREMGEREKEFRNAAPRVAQRRQQLIDGQVDAAKAASEGKAAPPKREPTRPRRLAPGQSRPLAAVPSDSGPLAALADAKRAAAADAEKLQVDHEAKLLELETAHAGSLDELRTFFEGQSKEQEAASQELRAVAEKLQAKLDAADTKGSKASKK